MKVKVYTKTGDSGETSLYGGKRVVKYHPRVAAYGTVDELNSSIGVVRAHLEDSHLGKFLESIQNDLFLIGSNLSGAPKSVEILSGRIKDIEKVIDEMDEKLPVLKNFILPGGSRESSFAHFARSVCRRAERGVVELSHSEDVDKEIIKYLNRLSDFLFVLARFLNVAGQMSEIIWKT